MLRFHYFLLGIKDDLIEIKQRILIDVFFTQGPVEVLTKYLKKLRKNFRSARDNFLPLSNKWYLFLLSIWTRVVESGSMFPTTSVKVAD